MNGGSIRNVISNAIVNVSSTSYPTRNCNVGGITGYMTNGAVIRNCRTLGNLTSRSTGAYDPHAGGIVGYIHQSGTIEYCYSSSTIQACNLTRARGSPTGGIAGTAYVQTGTININKCVVTSTSLSNTYERQDCIGRIWGYQNSTGSGLFSCTNNFARDNITVNWDISSNPRGKTISSSLTGKDGLNVTDTNLKTQSWWQTSSAGPLWSAVWYDNNPDNAENRPWKWNTTYNEPVLWFE